MPDRKRSGDTPGISWLGKKLSMQQQLLEKMKEQNCLVDAYLRNREGVLVSRDKDSVPYTAQIWV